VEQETNQFLGEEHIGKLMRKYAIPCIISLLVGALYNIVDQIFIANASYLGSYGNAANTVVFPLTVIALAIIDKVGRKQLVWWGVGGMIFCLLMIGLYFLPFTNLPTWFMLVFFLLYVFCTAISISAVVFVLLSEMYPNRVRGLAMSIAGFALWIGTYLIGQLTPWMLETLTPAGTFFLFAFMCIPYLWIMYKYVPNTTGKTLEEIEEYWSRFGSRGDKAQSIK